jgi:hypothetical protein
MRGQQQHREGDRDQADGFDADGDAGSRVAAGRDSSGEVGDAKRGRRRERSGWGEKAVQADDDNGAAIVRTIAPASAWKWRSVRTISQ